VVRDRTWSGSRHLGPAAVRHLPVAGQGVQPGGLAPFGMLGRCRPDLDDRGQATRWRADRRRARQRTPRWGRRRHVGPPTCAPPPACRRAPSGLRGDL